MTKPKVQSLLLFTTVTTMYVAGDPSLGLVLLTCLGGALSAGGAGAINHALDRDIDASMKRTADRPVAVAAACRPRAAIAFGIAARHAPRSRCWPLTVNALAARCSRCRAARLRARLHALAEAHARRRTSSSAAPPAPCRRSWPGRPSRARSSGSALYLFAIVFYWTPPHFWALSLLMKDEYATAGVPMLPVVRGEAETRRQILLYTILLVAVTLLPFAFGAVRRLYLVAALALGAAFTWLALRLRERADRRSALRLYLFSLAYLALLFARDGGRRAGCKPELRPTLQGVRLALLFLLLPLALAACGSSGPARAPVRLTIGSPSDGARLIADKATVSGTVSPRGATVLVGGKQVAVAGGSFSASVPLEPGTNVVDVVAASPHSKAAMTAVRIYRQVAVSVPDVVGQSPSDASAALTAKGLKPKLHESDSGFDFFIPRSQQVCSTTPSAGEQVPPGTSVDVESSKLC